MASTIEKQIEVFVAGTDCEHAFPAELSADERRLVKVTAEKLGLSSRSFGMAAERRIHIFKASKTPASEAMQFSVKNTFIDGLTTDEEAAKVGPAHQFMPVCGGAQDSLAAEEPAELGSAVDKLSRSPTSSQDDTVDTAFDNASSEASSSDQQDSTLCIKNTFVHIDANENGDPRIVQSMPNCKFAETLEADMLAAATAAAAAKLAKQNRKPLPLAEEPATTGLELFPSTPNADSLPAVLRDLCPNEEAQATPMVHWVPSGAQYQSAAEYPCITTLPPASWVSSSAPVHGYQPVSVPQAPPPPSFAPGTPVVLTGLASQPDFNGRHGTVRSFDAESSRYNIMLEMCPNANQRMVKVKFQNLLFSQPMLPPGVPYIQPSATMNRTAQAPLTLDQMV